MNATHADTGANQRFLIPANVTTVRMGTFVNHAATGMSNNPPTTVMTLGMTYTSFVC